MKTGFFNSLVYIVFIILIIAGITPGMVSAVNDNPEGTANSNNGNLNTVSSDSTTPVPAVTSDNSGSDSTSLDNGNSGNNGDTVEETPADPATTPADPATTPADPATTPADPATTPADPATTPADPATTPADPATTPADPATTPADPATTPADPATTPADPATTPTEPVPTPTEIQKSTPVETETPQETPIQTPTQTPQETPTQEQQITPTPSPSDSGSNSDSGSDSNSRSHSKSSMGSGVSQEAPENIAAKELDTENIISGYHITYNFTENATPITYIEYDAKRTFRKTTSIAEVLVNKSSLVSELPYGKIYRHVNIWVGQQGAGLPTSIENGFVGFKVERAWIRDNSINETFVTLQWFDREWQPLETEKIGEDEVYLYFKAKTPGYSSFAITEFTPEDAQKAEIEGTSQIQRALQSLTDNTASVLHANMQKQILAQKAKKTAKIIMALSLPLFMLVVGYCIFKKKI